jgi:serine/threonine-protein kinase RsbW
VIADRHLESEASPWSAGPTTFRMSVRARATAVTEVRHALTEWASFLPADRLGDLVIAANELVSNSVRHGPADGRIDVTAEHGADGVRVEACDEGHATVAPNPEPGPAGGYGLGIVEAVAQRWGTSADPTCVWFTLATAA